MNESSIDQSEIDATQKKYKITPIKPINLKDYKSITLTEMMKEAPSKADLILDPILRRQGIGWIYAATGMGKTLFTLNLAYAIAGGGSFLKYAAPKPLKVLYVDGEMSYSELYSRVMVIKQQQGDLDFEDNLHFLTPDKVLPLRIPKIDIEEGQCFYQEKVIQEKFDVVIFDNLSMLSSFDENKSHEWKSIQNWLIHLRALGITILMVHHAGKDKNGYRGTSSLMDGANFAISLQPIIETKLEDQLTNCKKFKLVYTKNRDFHGKDAVSYEISFINGQWLFQSIERSEIDTIVELVALKMTQRDIAKELGISLGKVNLLIKRARESGLILGS